MNIDARKLKEVYIHHIELTEPDERFYVIPIAQDYAISTYGQVRHIPTGKKARYGLTDMYYDQGYWIIPNNETQEKVISTQKLMIMTFFDGKGRFLKRRGDYLLKHRWDVRYQHLLMDKSDLIEWMQAIFEHRSPRYPRRQQRHKFTHQMNYASRTDADCLYWNARQRATNDHVKEIKPRYKDTTMERALIEDKRLFEAWFLQNQYYYPEKLELDKDLLGFGEKNCYHRKYMCLLPHYLNDFFCPNRSKYGYGILKKVKDGVTYYTVPSPAGEARTKCATYAKALELGRKRKADKIREMAEKEKKMGYMPRKLIKTMLKWADLCEEGKIRMWEPSAETKESEDLYDDDH